ncbi:hypothetical protein [Fundidesulfovibrio terrae]|uniref:hypothetical protein n=1 Tax=Fundidesulfovibrio terrae TaxID=2922866 RepID=UPI001FAEBEB6|nr:hypothetical protein [Fundidesulfovibrio terrae]
MSTISSLSGSNQLASIGLISGTGEVQTTSVTDALAQGQGTDSANISEGGQLMNKLKQLQSSDPEKFKEVAQTISDKLSEQAKNTTDTGAANMLSDMASGFADAAKTGSMDSLKPKSPPSGSMNGSGLSKNMSAFNKSSMESTFGTVNTIISDALSGTTSSSSTSTTSSSTVASTSVTATGSASA